MKQYVSKFSGKELDERLTRVDNIPTKTSELNNDSGFISEAEADNKYTDKNKTDVLEGDIKDLKDRLDAEIPTKISQLENDKKYITDSEVQNKLNNLNNTVDYFGDVIELSITSKGGNIDSVEVNEGVLVDTLLKKANLDENGKIIASQLPDYILGQVMFGGLIYSNGTITASSNFISKYGNDTNISASEASKYNGVYFIVTGDAVNITIAGVSQVSTGDWIISVGDSWKKIDNSDAVTSVAGLVGNVNASSLAAALSDITDSNSLARKTDLPKKLSELEADIEIGGGGTSDWNASEGELGYIKNRTHFSKVIFSENVTNVTDAYIVPISIGEDSIAYLRITSDYMSDMVRVKDGEVIDVDHNGNYAILHFDGMGLELEIITEDPAGYDGNFHLDVIEYNPLDDKYIPETIVRASKDGYLYSNGEKVDMRFTRSLLPVGTSIPKNAKLNTIEFLKIGKYYCSLNADAKTIENCPVNVAFSMEVFNPLGTNVDDETTRDYTYRLRVLTQYDTGQQYMQFCRTNGTAGSWIYDSWYVTPRVKFALASSKNDGSAAIGATNKGVYVDSTGEIKAMSYTIGKSVPTNAVFTDTNTKVTSVGNHYTPTEDEYQQIDAPEGEVVTGIKRDAAGHVVGVVSTIQEVGETEYESAIADKTLTTPNAVGGIAKGTKVSDLEGKTFAEMFDDLLFPTVNPTFTAPSASIAFKNYSSTQEVGATGPTSANFTTGYSAGEIKLNGVKQANRGGTLDSTNSFIYVNGNSSNKTLPTKVTLGSTTFKYRAAYNQGPQPKNNKGGNYDSPLAAGTVDSSAITLNGTYPWYASTSAATSTNPVVKQSLVAWNSTAGKMSTGQFTVQPSGTLPQVFKLPRKIDVLQLKNALNGNMENVEEINGVPKDYTESTETINIGGTDVTYYVYTYSGSTRGSVTLLAKF